MRLRDWFHEHPTLTGAALLIGGGLLLNVVPSKLVAASGLSLYLDGIGTVAVAMLGGCLPAVVVGFGANAINGISEPATLYYGVVSILIAGAAAFFHAKHFFRTPLRLLAVVFTLAAIGGVVGSVITYLLNGLSFCDDKSTPYAQAIERWLGCGPLPAQFLANFALDLADKAVTVAAGVVVFRLVPPWARRRFDRVFLRDTRHLASDAPLRHSLLRKVVCAVVAAEVLLGGLACGIGLFLYRDRSLQHFADLAYGVSRDAARFIDANRVGVYLTQGEAAPGYRETEAELQRVKDCYPQTKFLYVYQIRPDGCHVVFDLDVPGVPGGDPGAVVPIEPAFVPFLPQLLKGEPIEPLVSDESFGKLLTVYTPLKDRRGETVAYVAVDVDIDTINADTAVFFVKLLALFFGLSIIIMGVVIALVKRDVVAPVNQMSNAAMKFAFTTMMAGAEDAGKVDLGRIRRASERVQRLKIESVDEIGNLFDSFSTMVLNTCDFIEQLERQAERINQMQEIIITEFAEVVEARDKSTGDHVKKTAAYVEALARQLQKEGKYPGEVTDEFIMKLKRSAPLHDIGKIAVSDLILNKQGKLTDEEFRVMKSHTVEGWKFFTKMVADAGDAIDPNYLKESIEMAHYHHEKWDGTGYPDGLKGEAIPLSARIMAVADVFDALIAERVYKKPFTYEKAMAIVTEGAGKHFDPVVVEAFTHIAEQLYRERTVLAKPAPGADPAPPPPPAGGPA